MAIAEKLIKSAKIVVHPHIPTWYEGRLQADINRDWEIYAEDCKSQLETLRGIKANIEYVFEYPCSECGHSFEVDDETGLTACCGKEIG